MVQTVTDVYVRKVTLENSVKWRWIRANQILVKTTPSVVIETSMSELYNVHCWTRILGAHVKMSWSVAQRLVQWLVESTS